MLRFFPFDVKKKKGGAAVKALTLFLRYILGAACTGIFLFLGTNLIEMIGEASSVYRIIAFIIYALLGALVTAGVPWLFIQTGLSVKK
jgi:hypothetical protein